METGAPTSDPLDGDPLAIAAHDLRGPLMCIEGWAELLKERLPDARAQAGLAAILRSARMSRRILDNVMDAAVLGRGPLPLAKEPVRLAALLAEAAEAASPCLGAAGVRVVVEGGGADDAVEADPHLIGRVIFNLLTNALRHTYSGGTVALRLRPLPGRVVVSIQDTGCGIGPAELAGLFEKGRRGSNAKGAGLGLGLYLCREIVRAHGGEIWAESAGPGRGATFSFSLPLAGPPPREEAGQEQAPSGAWWDVFSDVLPTPAALQARIAAWAPIVLAGALLAATFEMLWAR